MPVRQEILELTAGGKKDRDQVNMMFFNFVACLTGIGITTTASKEAELWELYGTGGL
jgi:hypothetical protein